MAKDKIFDLASSLVNVDFLVRNNGVKVNIDTLKGTKFGLYFSASWSGSCQHFTPTLIETYNELIAQRKGFEIVFISADEEEESFNDYFSKMPWLAIPFSASKTRDNLEDLFEANEIPHLVILDENEKVLTVEGVEIIRDFEAEGYPFTPQKIKELKELVERAKKEQTLKSILVSKSRDFLLSSNGDKVPVSQLEGKTVGLYFLLSSHRSCIDFTSLLVQVHEKLRANGESLEIVLVPLDEDEESHKQKFGSLSWYSLPFNEKSCVKLARYFDLSIVPTLVIVGPNGKTLHFNATQAIEHYGVEAYPFTPERFEELAQIEKVKQETQTLESLLVSGDRDFVIDNTGAKVLVSHLVGKYIFLYFSAHWCPPCRSFLPKLIETYWEIKEKDDAFEVIFISSDKDPDFFMEFFSAMPWLALPFEDPRKAHLISQFKVFGIPKLIVIGPSGRTMSTEAREVIMVHGSKAYPFTEERVKEIESQIEEMARDLPEKVNYDLHKEHELVLTRRVKYTCECCKKDGCYWSFFCEECNFDVHPSCALETKKSNQRCKQL